MKRKKAETLEQLFARAKRVGVQTVEVSGLQTVNVQICLKSDTQPGCTVRCYWDAKKTLFAALAAFEKAKKANP